MAATTLSRNQQKQLQRQMNIVRQELKSALAANNSLAIDDAFKKLVAFNISLKRKCNRISIAHILRENCTKPQSWNEISKALGILDRYAGNLLKPKEERPAGWDAIMVKNDIFVKCIEPIVGMRQILTEIGYKRRDEDFIRLDVEPKPENLLWLRVDLKVAKIELDLYRNKSHPYPELLNELVCSEARIEQDPTKQNTYVQNVRTPPPVIARKPDLAVSSLTSSTTASNTQQRALEGALTARDAGTRSETPPSTDGQRRTSASSTVAPDGDGRAVPQIEPPPYEECKPPFLDSTTGRAMSEPVWKKREESDNNESGRYSGRQDSPPIHAPPIHAPPIHAPPTQASRAGANDPYPQEPIHDRDPSRLPSLSAPPDRPAPPAPQASPAPPAPPAQHAPLHPNLKDARYDTPAAAREKQKPKTDTKQNKSFLERMKSMFSWGSSEVEPGQEIHEVGTADQHESDWSLSKKNLQQIRLEPDLNRRLQKLDLVIPFLEMEVADHEKAIEEIISQDDDYTNNKDYQFLTKRKDFLKRELIFMKRDRNDVRSSTDRGSGDPVSMGSVDPVRMGSGNRVNTGSGDPVRRQEAPVREKRGGSKPTNRPSNKNDKWACEHCTFHNSMDLNVCSACSKTADVKVKVEAEVEVEEPEDGYVTPTEEFVPEQSESECATSGNNATPAQIENGETDVNQFLDWLTMADERGYTVQQFEFAVKACVGSQVSPIDWLDNNWAIMVDILVVELAEEGRNGYGGYSKREAENALAASVNGKAPLELCLSTRRSMVDSMTECYNIRRDDVVKTIVDNEGDEQIICQKLNARVLKSLLEEISQIEAEEPLYDKQLYEMAHDKNLKKEHQRVALMLERGVIGHVADRVLNIIQNDLLDPEEYDVPPSFTEIVEAAKSARSNDEAFEYLRKRCNLCADYHPESRFMCMFTCDCRMCKGCFLQYFEFQVRNYSASRFNCPSCPMPDIEHNKNEDATHFHFQMLDTVLKTEMKQADYECFQQKLFEWNCLDNPNFRWCQTDNCRNGFLVEPEAVARQRKVTCPKCRSSICFNCKKQWEKEHAERTCEEFADWQEQNHPDVLAMEKLLQENGIICPKCKSRFELARGGCLHFKCSHDACRHEFCAGCNLEMSKTCRKYPQCAGKGIHAHHPRYCLYSLRDMQCQDLLKILIDAGVELRGEEPRAQGAGLNCRVMEQKEVAAGLVDMPCDKPIYTNTGLCELHYKEYLVNLVNRHKIDPVVIMDLGQLRGHLGENRIPIPQYPPGTGDEQILQNLRQLVRDGIPLEYN